MAVTPFLFYADMTIDDQMILEYLSKSIENGTAIVDYLEPSMHRFNNNYPVINIEVTYSSSSLVFPFFTAIHEQFDKDRERRAQEREAERFEQRSIVPERKKNTYLYVMIDKRTGYYKIGRSKDPSYREKTLQSDAPDIELLFHYEAYTNQEKELHQKYAEKRVRGEWFQLDENDLEEIKNIVGNDQHTF